MTSARKKAYLAMVVYELIMGASQPLIKPILSIITPAQFLFLRYLIAGIIMLPFIFFRLSKSHSMNFKTMCIVIFTETLGVLNLLLLYTGLKFVTSLQSSFIVNTRPIFMTIVGVLFLSEHEESHEWAGLAMSVIGTAFILLQPIISHQTTMNSNFSFIGMSMIVLTNIIYTIVSGLVKHNYHHLDKFTISGIHMWIGLGLFFTYLSSTHSLPSLSVMQNPTIALGVLFMALLGSALGIILSDYAYTHIETSEASLFIYLQPLVYIPLSVLWLKETISPFQLIGMIFVFLGVFWASRRPSSKKISQANPLYMRMLLAEAPTERPRLFSHK
jgi:drug/metabolite transporter (DMT)-like permease